MKKLKKNNKFLLMKEVGKKKYPHKHILGIEGLSPPDINYLLNLSEKFS